MPFLSLLDSGLPAPDRLTLTLSVASTFEQLVLTLSVSSGEVDRLALTLNASTAAIVTHRLILGLFARTLELPSAPIQVGGGIGGAAYQVSGNVVSSYSVVSLSYQGQSDDEGVLTDSMTLVVRGQAEATGEWSALLSGSSGGTAAHKAELGPLRGLNSKQTLKATGWETTITTADTALMDLRTTSLTEESLEGRLNVLPELVPWEKERDLTTLEQAQNARNDALKQQKIRLLKLKCPQKRLLGYDPRAISVDGLVVQCLSSLGAAVPFVLCSSANPYAGSLFRAETRVTNGVEPDPQSGAVILIGTSYSTKGRTPLEVVRDIWGRIGYVTKVKRGRVWIGWPSDIDKAQFEQGAGTALALPAGVSSWNNVTETQWRNTDSLESLEIEKISAGATSLETENQAANASFDLPRAYRLTGAAYEKRLPPIPPDPDEDELDPDSDLKKLEIKDDFTATSVSKVERRQGNDIVLESITTSTFVKAGGLIRQEIQRTAGLRPSTLFDVLSGESRHGEAWAADLRSSVTEYTYQNRLYPETLTQTSRVVRAYKSEISRVVLEENFVEISTYHSTGYLSDKIRTVKKLEGFTEVETTSIGGVTVKSTFANYRFETEVERHTPVGKNLWKHSRRHSGTRSVPVRDQAGEIIGTSQVNEPTTLEDTLDDQKPPGANSSSSGSNPDGKKEDECKPSETLEGFTYQERIERVFYTAGRGPEEVLDLPWLEGELLFGSLIDKRTEESIYQKAKSTLGRTRVTLGFAAPIAAVAGGALKSVSITYKAPVAHSVLTFETPLPRP